ncbi:MAG: sodium-dependent transporter [Gracilibacteraceae bacterium]|jgi:NSS family neurotransmitter:Na+ symporter|nr:sodium-dependent transporter [Gracilibacteraceae bacterium]
MEKETKTGNREQFGSKLGFILAAAGSAVGLGNIWKFPYLAGSNGGGAFVLVYLLCVVVIGFSLMLMEMALGRNTQLSTMGAYRKLDKRFTFIGVIGVVAAFLIVGYYPVVGGWSVAYFFKTLIGELSTSNPETLGGIFGALVSGTWAPIFWTVVYMALNVIIVIGGIQKGIEKASKVMMPALFIVLLILAVRSVTLPGAGEGLKFLFAPDWSKLSGQVMLAAMGQAFFSLSLGMGCIITYASYLGKKENLVSNSLNIPAIDTLVAILSGVVIIPAAVSFGFEVTQGPGLVFVTVPAIFATMGPVIGRIFGLMFFLLVALAALTSSISLLEVVVAFFIDEIGFNRKKAVATSSTIGIIMCIAASLSMGAWSNITLFGMNIFDFFDYVASYICLPLGGMFVSIFVGWFWGKKNAYDEVTNEGTIKFALFDVWFFLCKWVIPIGILFVFLSGVGII